MNIRYLFIASAVTSGLALAIQSSESIANKQPSPIAAPYTVYETDSQLLKPVSGTPDTLSILKVQGSDTTETETQTESGDTQALHQNGKQLLSLLSDFLRTLFTIFIQTFIAMPGSGASNSS